MKVYLDYIFIENFLIDFILLKETSMLAKEKTKNRFLVLSSIISSAYVLLMVVLKVEILNYLISKILLAVVITYISFKPDIFKKYIRLLILFFAVSIINVGTVEVITNLLGINQIDGIQKVTIYISGFLISKLIIIDLWKIYKLNLKSKSLIYDVTLKMGKKKYKYKAFLDTGNNVYSYHNDLPIVFAEIKDENQIKILDNMQSFEINTITLSNKTQKRAYLFNNVEIFKEGKTWYVDMGIVFEQSKFSKNNQYDMILNYILFSEKLGGISL